MKLLYFIYVLKKTDYTKLNAFIKHAGHTVNQSYLAVVWDMLKCFWRFNTTFLDYFYFEFYLKSDEIRSTYSDTLYMYRFQKKINDNKLVPILSNKDRFYERFADFVCHKHFLTDARSVDDFKTWILDVKPTALMIKNSKGQVGAGIEKIKIVYSETGIVFNDLTLEKFYSYVLKNQLNLIEVYIEQHHILNEIYGASLNTIRAITVVDNNQKVHILGCILRMGAGKSIDNFDAGGISARIDVESGIIIGPLVIKDPRKSVNGTHHPISNAEIIGVQLPFWEASLALIQKAALHLPGIRTVGWDVVLTEKGPYLLEGNHNWDKTHWQICFGKGLKHQLEQFS